MSSRCTRLLVAVLLAALAPIAGCSRHDGDAAASGSSASSAEKSAQSAAESWLALIDAGKYDESWDEAAKLFRGAVERTAWRRQVGGVRGPIGALTSRTLSSAKYTRTAPGAPDGEYVILQFDASFQNKKSAVETVTPMLDTDGKWRVSGYFIR